MIERGIRFEPNGTIVSPDASQIPNGQDLENEMSVKNRDHGRERVPSSSSSFFLLSFLELEYQRGIHALVALWERCSPRYDHKPSVPFFTHKREPAAIRFELSFDYLLDLVDAILCELFVCGARGPCDGSVPVHDEATLEACSR